MTRSPVSPAPAPLVVARAFAPSLLGGLLVAAAGGLLAISAGLLALAALAGWWTGVLLRPLRRGRTIAAVLVPAIGIAGGQVGLWLLALGEGGRLGLVDYLAATFGVLVPAQFLVAILAALAALR
jgi:hypothetical protein